MNFLSTQPYKGTRDFYPEEKRVQTWIFDQIRQVVSLFGYQEYDGPMLEPFELYAAKSGAEIVNQQLYSLIDRGERKMAIRPEMTPTLARMVAAKLQDLPKPIRWYSIPNLWRYERPQRGRLREHWQVNVDVLGGDSVQADAEVIRLSLEIIKKLGAADFFSIRVNNRRLMDHVFHEKLGLNQAQAADVAKAIDARAKIGTDEFVAWLTKASLDANQIQELEAFLQMDFAGIQTKYACPGQVELSTLFEILGQSKQVVFDPTIMRGMDYYTGTVFEGYDISPENRRALFGGGRYDNLVGLFGKNKLSGVGFGLGDVTLRDFLETHKLLPQLGSWVDVFITTPNAKSQAVALNLASELRKIGIKVVLPLSFDGFGAQLKLAAKQGARFALLLGEDELSKGEVAIKNLEKGTQEVSKLSDVAQYLKMALNK